VPVDGDSRASVEALRAACQAEAEGLTVLAQIVRELAH
jgi:hypothetical protein